MSDAPTPPERAALITVLEEWHQLKGAPVFRVAADLLRADAERIAELEARNTELKSFPDWYGCFTGDCPHDMASECVAAIRKELISALSEATAQAAVDASDKLNGNVIVGLMIQARADAERIAALEAEVKGLYAFKRGVDEALNSGDGSYRP